VDLAQLIRLIDLHKIPSHALVWRQGLDGWARADAIPDISAQFPPAEPASVPSRSPQTSSSLTPGPGTSPTPAAFLVSAPAVQQPKEDLTDLAHESNSRLNSQQRVVLALGIAAFLALGLRPPWTMTQKQHARTGLFGQVYQYPSTTETASGHAWIMDPPQAFQSEFFSTSYRINYGGLAVELGVVVVLTAGAMVLSRQGGPRR